MKRKESNSVLKSLKMNDYGAKISHFSAKLKIDNKSNTKNPIKNNIQITKIHNQSKAKFSMFDIMKYSNFISFYTRGGQLSDTDPSNDRKKIMPKSGGRSLLENVEVGSSDNTLNTSRSIIDETGNQEYDIPPKYYDV